MDRLVDADVDARRHALSAYAGEESLREGGARVHHISDDHISDDHISDES